MLSMAMNREKNCGVSSLMIGVSTDITITEESKKQKLCYAVLINYY